MNRASILLIVLTLITLPVAAQTKGNAEDQEAIKSIALAWQDSWNRHDMKALTALVAEDVDFITVAGKWRKTRREFEEHHANPRHEMQYRESVWTTKHVEVKVIRPDVAVAHVEWGIKGDKDPDGTLRQPRQGISTWVVEKRKGKWLIIATQNTNLREERSLPMNAPEAELSITLERSQAPSTFHLSARNTSHSSVLIVRPRVHTVDTYGSWGGWSLHVQGPGGPFHAFTFPGGIPPFTSSDLIELRPGESVGVVINLSRFTRDDKSVLADLPGKYTVVVGYRLEQDKVVLASGSANGEGFVPVPVLPAMESEAVQFVVPGNGK